MNDIDIQALEEREPDYIPLQVTTGVLLHIGAGIYQSAAGAIKELVSNSFDADATDVVISTNYPRFDEIRVVDNGFGMTVNRFKKAMRSIGSSLKGTIDKERISAKYKRPIIGNLGIGLMALSQICDQAYIESQAEGLDTKFIAKLDFAEFRRRSAGQKDNIKLEILRDRALPYGGIADMGEMIKNADNETKEELSEIYYLASQADEILKSKDVEDTEDENLGYCMIYEGLPAVKGEHGTSIKLVNIDGGVQGLLKDADRSSDVFPAKFKNQKEGWYKLREEIRQWSWKELCESLRQGASGISYHSLPYYYQFLWELAVLTPVNYFEYGPITIQREIFEEKKNELNEYNFNLRVDNRLIYKPILLPSGSLVNNLSELEKVYDFYIRKVNLKERVVDGDPLEFHGYIYWQRKQVEPSSIRGIQIYIRNVGIGIYDRTLLNFTRRNPSHRSQQMSGEIFINKGLERALNVDRNSFRETDAHYLELTKLVWNLLGSGSRKDGVIGMSVESYYLRKDRDNEKAEKLQKRELRDLVERSSKGKVKLKVSQRKTETPYIIRDDTIVLNENSPKWPRARKDRSISQQVLLVVKAAISSGASPEEILNILEELLLK